MKNLIEKIENKKQAILDLMRLPSEEEIPKLVPGVEILEARYKSLCDIHEILLNTEIELISDGYHTFDELYFHRMILFSVICSQNREKSWKSKLHADGTMFKDYFIVGINTPLGQYSYHYHMQYWDHFCEISELEKAPEWDGHTPDQVHRLISLVKSNEVG